MATVLPGHPPRFCISVLEEQAPEEIQAQRWRRRRPCCDCGRTVIYAPMGLLWELLRDYLIICSACAHERTIAADGSMNWTYDVRPRPKPGLN